VNILIVAMLIISREVYIDINVLIHWPEEKMVILGYLIIVGVPWRIINREVDIYNVN